MNIYPASLYTEFTNRQHLPVEMKAPKTLRKKTTLQYLYTSNCKLEKKQNLIVIFSFEITHLTLSKTENILISVQLETGIFDKTEFTLLHVHIFFIYYLLIYWAIDLMSRVSANGPGDRGSIPGRVIPKTKKLVLDASLFNTQHY